MPQEACSEHSIGGRQGPPESALRADEHGVSDVAQQLGLGGVQALEGTEDTTTTLTGRPRTSPRGRLVSADLFGQGDDDARRAAEVAEPEDGLVLCHVAEEFGAVGAQTGDGVVDVVDGEHDAMQA